MAKCNCREPKSHRDCAYCGFGGDGVHVCGQCRDNGIDGPVIRGTSRVRCERHKKVKTRRQYEAEKLLKTTHGKNGVPELEAMPDMSSRAMADHASPVEPVPDMEVLPTEEYLRLGRLGPDCCECGEETEDGLCRNPACSCAQQDIESEIRRDAKVRQMEEPPHPVDLNTAEPFDPGQDDE